MREIDNILMRAWETYRHNNEGAVADYIPELGKASREDFGIAIASVGGDIRSIGMSAVEFTIQSISKVFSFCLALEVAGFERVAACVGVEPSGDPFNAIIFDPSTNRPFNPMVNAGAITIAGLLHEALGADAFNFILDRMSTAAGRQLTMNEKVFHSEDETGHRNRAIGHLLLATGTLVGRPDEALDVYFRQCSINVTAIDLANMGATLANMGENATTGRQAFDIEAVRGTLAVMFTCGMYDYSGRWAYDVGIPAKSGVGGGILGVVNRQIGIATYAPPLDSRGNSVRGIAAFRMLSDEFGLHSFDWTNVGSSFISSVLR